MLDTTAVVRGTVECGVTSRPPKAGVLGVAGGAETGCCDCVALDFCDIHVGEVTATEFVGSACNGGSCGSLSKEGSSASERRSTCCGRCTPRGGGGFVDADDCDDCMLLRMG